MKLQRPKQDELSAALTQTLLLVLVCSMSVMLSTYASDPTSWNDPSWWTASGGPVLQQVVSTNDGIVTTNYPANYYAAANQGQLKLFTARAANYLNATLTNNGGAGAALSNVVYGWQQDYLTNGYSSTNIKPSDYQVINLGQLKYVAGLVYGQLASAGYTGLTPSWLQPNPNTDYMVANLGQLKTAFNFNLSVAPPSVIGLTVSSSNPDELDLSWTLPNNNSAESFTLLQSTDGGTTWTTVATLNPTDTSYSITGLDSGTTYSYLLEANNQVGASASATTTPTRPSPRIPPSPTGVSGYLDSSYHMNVFWTPSPGAVRYTIDRETVTNGLWTTNFASSTSTNYPDTSYTNTGFRYRVSAVNSSGTPSAPSGVFPLPRYALIDLGTNFMPIGVTTNGLVAGNIYDYTASTFWGQGGASGAVWQNGGPTQRLNNSLCVQGVNNLGQMVGQDTANVAASWTNAGMAPTYPNGYPNGGGGYYSPGRYPLGSQPGYIVSDFSGETAVSDTGLLVGFTADDSPVNGVLAAQYPTGGSISLLMPNELDGNGGITYSVYPLAAGGSHWAGVYEYSLPTSSPPAPNGQAGFVIDGNEIPITGLWFDWDEPNASDFEQLYSLNGINASGTAVGVSPAGAVAYSGTTPTVLGQGEALAINSTGQIVGDDLPETYQSSAGSYFRAGNALLWEQTNYDGTASTSYVQKSLNDLVPDTTGWLLNAATGINNNGVIVGTYVAMGTDGYPIENSDGNPVSAHGFMLAPYALTNLADPYLGMTNASAGIQNPGHNGQDTRVDLVSTMNSPDINSVAWIAASDPNNIDTASGVARPRMPHLQASIAAPSGTTVWWKLSVIFHGQNNPANNYRDFDPSANLTSTNITQLTNSAETGSVGYSDDIAVPVPGTSADTTGNAGGWLATPDGWVTNAAGKPWNIYQDNDWQANTNRGFFGGDATLSVKITQSGTTNVILPEQDYMFRIAGENPSTNACETYIDQRYNGGNAASSPQRWTNLTNFTSGTVPPIVPGYWFAYACAKEETDQDGGRTWYNNFMDNGGQLASKPHPWSGHEGRPDWNNDDLGGKPQYGTGGYGLFQLTFEGSNADDPTPEPNFIMPRDWIWNWQSNVQQFLPIIQSKLQATQYYVNRAQSRFGASFTDPSLLPAVKAGETFNFWESSVITRNNGGFGWYPHSTNSPTIWGQYHPTSPTNGYLYNITEKGINNNP